jgi:MoxR-like ATPase
VDNIQRVVAGNEEACEQAVLCLLAGGNILLEGVPGVGKTTLARALAVSIGGSFNRVQATPDLLPSDLTGISVYDQADGSFRFVPGPIFANVVLVDEINRTTPRTQSALLEPMEERQATVEGVTHRLPEPFLVIATENPVEQHGTYPLPEGQLDRFALAIQIGYPVDAQAQAVVRRQLFRHPIDDLQPVVRPELVLRTQRATREIHVDDAVIEYALEIVQATRAMQDVALGASPRASVSLVRLAQARAASQGRGFVLPDDVKALAIPSLAHRLVPVRSRDGGASMRDAVRRVIDEVHVPLHTARS